MVSIETLTCAENAKANKVQSIMKHIKMHLHEWQRKTYHQHGGVKS